MWLYCIAHFETLEQCLYEQRYIHPCFIPSHVVVALAITSGISISWQDELSYSMTSTNYLVTTKQL